MKYEFAEDIQKIAENISKTIFSHVRIERVKCYRSFGTSSKRTIARCHTIGKLIQKALNVPAFYVLEFLAERFDKMSEDERIKVIIHELMHIPNTFGGGFRHHDHACDKNVEIMYKTYLAKKKEKENFNKKFGLN